MSSALVLLASDSWSFLCAPKRSARSLICPADSSPLIYSTGVVSETCAATCSSSVLLPIPGWPAIKAIPPGIKPPPSTRSSSPKPLESRFFTVSIATSFNFCGLKALPRLRAIADLPLLTAACSSSEFHAPQLSHLPDHLL